MEKPFFNFLCADRKTWLDLLTLIQERDRFSCPDKYDQELLDKYGRPLFISAMGFDAHVYPFAE